MVTRWIPFLLLICVGCQEPSAPRQPNVQQVKEEVRPLSLQDSIRQFFEDHPDMISDGFDFPVGKPNGTGYYNAQPFGKNLHLGDDWNAVTGGNSDLGDSIFAIGHGLVTVSKDFGGGWGNVVRVIHRVSGAPDLFVESLYAHCDTLLVTPGDLVERGDLIATIGNAGGVYYAHLHLEIRKQPGLPLGGGYGRDTTKHVDPTSFIKSYRP